MGDVYRSARQVILWLGAGELVTEKYMRRVSQIGSALMFERRFLSSKNSLIKAVSKLPHPSSPTLGRVNYKPVWVMSLKGLFQLWVDCQLR